MRVVDTEKLVSYYLRDVDSLPRVVGEPPAARDDPWIRVTQLASANLTPPEYFTRAMVQFDCYAGEEGGQPEAIRIALDLREALAAMAGAHELGVVTAALITNQTRLPDPGFEPARERVVVTADVYAHPVEVAA